MTHKIPEKVLGRLRALTVQRQQLDSQIQLVVQTVLEALGLEGEFNVDLTTGEIQDAAKEGPVKEGSVG